ncbi:MAG: GatB/YqeY domain-containing protein [Tenericutes bacterium]|nr:GatB/YqeY domain-containing protein [Mycoplasmatota bacterium]
MNLVQELDKEIIEAMKAKDSVRLATLRGVKGAIKLQSIDHKKEINDELLIDVVSKEIKSRNESIKEFEKGNRQDLIDKTKEEIDILSKYLPEQLSEDEIITIINQVFEEVKPSGIKDMGKVMGKVTPLVKGKADMGLVSSLIKEKLNS